MGLCVNQWKSVGKEVYKLAGKVKGLLGVANLGLDSGWRSCPDRQCRVIGTGTQYEQFLHV